VTVYTTGGGGTSNAQTFTVNNPMPTTTSLSPNSETVGDPAFTLTVNGTNFVAGSKVKWGGADRTTTYVSSTQLTVAIPASDIAGNGTASVTVVNPTPGGGTSNAQTFTINYSIPNIVSVTPSTSAANTWVHIAGTGFGTGGASSCVTFSKALNATTKNWTTTGIDAYVPAGAKTGNVTVTTQGGTSNGVAFTVQATTPPPKPSITKLSPTSGTTGSYIYVYGTNFEGSRGSSYVEFGSTRVSTYSSWSSTKIKVKVPSGISRTCSVVVHTPGGTSNFKTFKVTPAISSISPTSGKVGSKLTISGRSFGSKRYSSSYVKFGSKTVSSYTSWSNTKIVVNVPSGITGTVSVKVTTSGGTSNGLAFTVK
jgi:hypothetical protein